MANEPRADSGIIIDSDALLVRAQEALGPLMTDVLKEVNEKSIITNLLPSFTIPDKYGREMTLHAYTELRAQLVAQGGEAMEQRPEIIEEATIRLDKWQVALAIFDEALDDSGMNLDAWSQKGKASKAFNKSIDSMGLTELFGAVTPVTAVAGWAGSTDNAVRNEIVAGVTALQDLGYDELVILMNTATLGRFTDMVWVRNSAMTPEEFIRTIIKAEPIIVNNVVQKDMAGDNEVMFDVDGRVLIMDKNRYAVFSNKNMQTETSRNARRQLTDVIMTLLYKTKVLDIEGGYVIDGTGY